MRCNECGYENQPDAGFCRTCGSPLSGGQAVGSTAATVVAESVSAPAVRRRLLGRGMAIAVLAAVVTGVGGAYWWWNRTPGPYRPDSSGLYPIEANGRFGFMNRSGQTVIEAQFDDVGGFSEGLAAVRVGTKVGYINTDGTLVIAPQFDVGPEGLVSYEFRYGRAVVRLGDRVGVIGTEGQYVLNPDLREVSAFSDGVAAVRTAGGEWAFLDRSGALTPLPGVDVLYSPSGGLAPAATGGRWGYINLAGQWLINPQFDGAGPFVEGRAVVTIEGRHGYIDRDGRFVINPRFVFARSFSEGLAAVVDADGRYGFVDADGAFVVEPGYVIAFDFREGLAEVQTREGWGFIDRAGKVVIPPQFDAAQPFIGGLARVTIRNQTLYVDTAGRFVGSAFDPVVIVNDACPFEGCQYGEWRATAVVEMYAEIDGAPLGDQLSPGTTVIAVGGAVHATPSRAVVTRTYRTDEAQGIHVGEAIYPLHPLGEGAVAVWHGGRVKRTSLDLAYEYGRPDVRLEWTWWVQARLEDGRNVWLKNPKGFLGMGRYS